MTTIDSRRHGGCRMCAGYLHARGRSAFTLIEVLVVVAIIALLIAILLPSLKEAREHARTVRCLGNLSNLPKAVLMFAVDHKGYGQLVYGPAGGGDTSWSADPAKAWRALDADRSKYDYQTNAFDTETGAVGKPWVVSYARYIGDTTLKRMENYFIRHPWEAFRTNAGLRDPQAYFSKFGRRDVFICPSDRKLVNHMWSPMTMYGVYSYAISEDIFGHTPGTDNGPWRGTPTQMGHRFRTQKPGNSKRLEGKLDPIVRPSEVALFADGGREDKPEETPLLLSVPHWSGAPINGPYLHNVQKTWYRLPLDRHGGGRINVGLADGSGKTAQATGFIVDTVSKEKAPTGFAPKIRVSPYDVGVLPSEQP